MNVTKTQRILLFLFICMSVRLSFVWMAKTVKSENLFRLMGIIALGISAGFTYQFLKDKSVGAFGGDAWWNLLRPFHALTYLIFGIMALRGMHKYAWMVLLLDVIVGFLAFSQHYF